MDSIREILSIILGLVFSFAMPALVSFLKRSDWPSWKKVGIAVLVAISLGAITTVVHGQIDFENLAVSITAIFSAATVIYETWFKETRANGYLENKQVLP